MTEELNEELNEQLESNFGTTPSFDGMTTSTMGRLKVKGICKNSAGNVVIHPITNPGNNKSLPYRVKNKIFTH